ncbi:hypothetical protein B0H17DRAFT_1198412 [Mycena rosella]|uniref:Uncharacterized protein n=1 Tax=Mycena rosella TaxID=1033263 RepID=A0AAD7DNR3_MYCRO|nr:hypothetical protein B0H17DRAFT_1198412 [Mycena rosella]
MAHMKNTKTKEMFKPYDPNGVPDIMPFPELAHVATTKGEEAAVPKLNKHQRSWILDIGVCDVDLPSLEGKPTSDFYDRVKNDAFDAKAFQHKVQPQDREEEACVPALVATWKLKHKKQTLATADDGGTSDEEEDEGGHGALLREYSKAGWQLISTFVVSS